MTAPRYFEVPKDPAPQVRLCPCGAEMVFLHTAKGGRMPLSWKTRVDRGEHWDVETHFGDCPLAKEFSGRARKQRRQDA